MISCASLFINMSITGELAAASTERASTAIQTGKQRRPSCSGCFAMRLSSAGEVFLCRLTFLCSGGHVESDALLSLSPNASNMGCFRLRRAVFRVAQLISNGTPKVDDCTTSEVTNSCPFGTMMEFWAGTGRNHVSFDKSACPYLRHPVLQPASGWYGAEEYGVNPLTPEPLRVRSGYSLS
ncbi:hypothetical protein BKA62DRAFT_290853 [Auriculariales sp. MPI-PUGE-AT-0066]|nr:hypothetical protein BKA62DRAFT_290853 [Auriculariales sp. MPI-PUGE-AT-0066]